MRSLLFLLTLGLLACGTAEQTNSDIAAIPERPLAGIKLQPIENNVDNDTILVHETFRLSDGSFVMSARHIEEKFVGLRLYHYKVQNDEIEMLAISSPGYDSWMFRPNFFQHPEGGFLILAEIGYVDSWGQKVFHFTNQGFRELGTMEIAYKPETRPVGTDSADFGVRSIAPYTEITFNGLTPSFSFSCDSVFLYDDGRGNQNISYPGHRVVFEAQSSSITPFIAE